MNIELSQQEIEMLDKALQSWEGEATSTALIGGMFSTLLCPETERDKVASKSENKMKEAGDEGQRRRIQATFLRAKLFQALNRESEFSHQGQPI